MAKKVRYLDQRDSGFYARMAVPKELRKIVGKAELSMPLTAATRAEALRTLPAAVARMQETLSAARQAHKASAPVVFRKGQNLTPQQLAKAHYAAQTAFDDELRNADHRYGHGFIDEDYVRNLRAAVNGSASNDDLHQTLRVTLARYASNGNLKAEVGSPEWREAARALAVAELEALSRTAERDEGDFSGGPQHPLLTAKEVVPEDGMSARILCPDSTKSLAEIAADYVKERGASDQTNFECEATARVMEQVLGEAKPVYRLTRDDVKAFRNALIKAPVNYTKRFPGKTIVEASAANNARPTPYPLLNSRTVNDKYLNKLHAILNWCVRKDILPDNPATGIKVDTKRDRNNPPRVPFAPSDLGKIFAPAQFKGGKPTSEAQWAMLMALFSGARASELAQLKLDSIRTERGVLVMAVEEETKTAGSRRVIPIHSTLIALGMKDRVEALRAEGATHFFPDWYRRGMAAKAKAAKSGKKTLNHYFPRFVPKRFNDSYLPEVGIRDGRKTWHSFRHTFKTGLSLAGVDRSMQDALCGHTDHSAGGGYIHGASVEAKRDAIEKLIFDGLSFPA